MPHARVTLGVWRDVIRLVDRERRWVSEQDLLVQALRERVAREVAKAIANQTTQVSPGAPAHQAVLDNRGQLNTPSPPTAKPSPKPTSEGSAGSGSQ